jgi:hypothetical protein
LWCCQLAGYSPWLRFDRKKTGTTKYCNLIQ